VIPRVPHPWPVGKYPYDVFAGTGITPRTSRDELLELALELQASGAMSPEMRIAYDAIRPAAERLATDFFLYNPELCDPASLANEAMNLLNGQRETSSSAADTFDGGASHG
jgi:hypothetical protein